MTDLNAQTAAAKSWLESFHLLNDQLNPDISIPEFFTPDCEFRFPGHPLLKGQEAIINFFKQQSTVLESMKHTIGHIDVLPDRIYQEASIEYVLKPDPEKKVININGFAIFGKRVDEDKMRSFTVYLDPSPLAERLRVINAGVE
ncbi:hypothetical protein BO94DRAFT_529937 [Aspergillus sclerotioniger CBS 115572]|uniref:SnoaL-like domain-containing protein n=1 Tax=Aspergillus sclerotioniger CBS 115572 TaxID=1450535 RepID=A0A317XDF9_9EURO|nr:hypothetical protein BO94DRAFT_529937 [Aspergillus sclerotioniger CBS 115572]PWY96569.1 hypothetical protein BO94DRAFT_529937 [Aspergillus sclerotioniger CBS 115572]